MVEEVKRVVGLGVIMGVVVSCTGSVGSIVVVTTLCTVEVNLDVSAVEVESLVTAAGFSVVEAIVVIAPVVGLFVVVCVSVLVTSVVVEKTSVVLSTGLDVETLPVVLVCSIVVIC